MTRKSEYIPYPKQIRIYWKIVAGDRYLHPLNLTDIILDDHDFKIRKMNPETHEFIKYV